MNIDTDDTLHAAQVTLAGVNNMRKRIASLEAQLKKKAARSEYWRDIATKLNREIKTLKEKK